MKQTILAAGFALFRATGLHRLVAPLTAGEGAILMLHHVRPWSGAAFAPNRLLEITPEYLESVLGALVAQGYDLVSMDEAHARLKAPRGGRRFAALTFDDGYRDVAQFAAPILRRFRAPYTIFVTTGFADQTAPLWWLELEDAVRLLDRVEISVGGEALSLPAGTPEAKAAAFARLYPSLRGLPEDEMRGLIADLLARAGGARDHAARLCMDWTELAELARDPLCAIGVHTITHPMLAKHDAATMRRELAESRAVIESRLGRPATHLAYPVGDPTSAGAREFAAARELGFASAVTTRPGVLFRGHAAHMTALPRLSINGLWQTPGAFEALLSGAPFALWNRGRRLNVS
ncbi:MAG: Peptidoglycan/xylan/chitin deacetylase, PgdA/CDA1 family [Hyphomicrobiales bacterium]|nr:Peptidoglycan/xylan/chitin deacetylase, PgdA/CDA1 family [Hyphomicrobiales bacterium]